MNKKKWIAIAALSLVLTSCVATGAACSKKKNKTIDGTAGEYTWVYEQEFIDECDADMTIDGKATEALWTNKTYFEHRENRDDLPVKLTMTSAFTTKGVYFYGEAEDTTINYNGRFTMTQNSGFTLLVAAEDVNQRWRMDCLRLDLDAEHCRSWGQHHVTGKTVVEGEIGSDNTTKMTMEMFISWKALLNPDKLADSFDENGDLKADALPERIKVFPAYRQVINKGDAITKFNIQPTFTENEWVALYQYFGKDGYTQPDRADINLGNAANGLSKTSGWELTTAEKDENDAGVVKSIRVAERGNQAIYFKDVFAENFVVEATVTPNANMTNVAGTEQNGLFGLIAQKSFSEFRAARLSNGNSLGSNGFTHGSKIITSAMTYWPNRAQVEDWQQVDASKEAFLGNATATSVTLKLVKVGGNLIFFIDGKYAYQEYCSYLTDACAPGLYASVIDATFTNCSAEALAEDEVDAYLAELGLSRVDIQTSDGGEVLANKYYYTNTENIDLTVKPGTGYIISAFKVNGVDSYDTLCENIQQGKYTINRSNNDTPSKITIEAEFEYITKKDNRRTVNGTLMLDIAEKFTDKRPIANAGVYIYATNAPQYFYQLTTDEEGKFSLNLCKAGVEFPGGTVLAEEDTYTIVFTCNNQTYTQTFAVPDFAEGEEDTKPALDIQFNVSKEYTIGTLNSTAADKLSTTQIIENEQVVGTTWNYLADDGGVMNIWVAASTADPTGADKIDRTKYDAVTFSLDTTGAPENADLRMFFQLRNANYGTGAGQKEQRFTPTAMYAIPEGSTELLTWATRAFSATNNSSSLHIPAGFKGQVIMLFDDFTLSNVTGGLPKGEQFIQSKIWVMVDTTELIGTELKVGAVSFIDYAKSMFDSYSRIVSAPASAGTQIVKNGDTYTFGADSGLAWMKAGANSAMNHRAQDGFAFDIDTTNLTHDLMTTFMFKNGQEQDNTRATQAYLIAESDGAVTVKRYVEYAGYSDMHIAIPAGFKGKVVILFKDVNYVDATHAIGTSIDEKWSSLCSAVWMPTSCNGMNGQSFAMSNFAFVTNGAELVGQN